MVAASWIGPAEVPWSLQLLLVMYPIVTKAEREEVSRAAEPSLLGIPWLGGSNVNSTVKNQQKTICK
jgi:hypothetical protein